MSENDRVVVIELTNRCPLRCTDCPRTTEYDRRWGHHSRGFMRFSTFNRIIKGTADMPVTYVIGWRGEPTLNMDFPEMIHKLVEQKHQESRVVIETSGVVREIRWVGAGSGGEDRIIVDPDKVFEAMTLADRVVFSLHNRLSLKGYKTYLGYLSKDLKQEIWLTTVEGMDPNIDVTPPAGGSRNIVTNWKKVKNPGKRSKCIHLGREIAIAYDGGVSRCYFKWDPEPGVVLGVSHTMEELFDDYLAGLKKSYPDDICSACPFKKTRAPFEAL